MNIKSTKRAEFIDITRQIEEHLSAKNGLCVVYCPHTTAGLTLNEGADPDVQLDLLEAFDKLVPKMRFRHAEGNSDAHLKATLTGSSLIVPVRDGKLALGIWQKVFFCEFDGPRERTVMLREMQ